jgi:hypothetical protein
VVVGDLMNSITLLVYKAAEGSLEVRCFWLPRATCKCVLECRLLQVQGCTHA